MIAKIDRRNARLGVPLRVVLCNELAQFLAESRKVVSRGCAIDYDCARSRSENFPDLGNAVGVVSHEIDVGQSDRL